MAPSEHVNSVSSHEVLVTFVGCTMLGVGTCCFLGQLLTPWTSLGSAFYAIVGLFLSAYKSQTLRRKFISCVPLSISELFDKDIMELIRNDSPWVQLLAFIVACAVLSSSDAHQLAECLPENVVTRLPAIQFLTGSNTTLHKAREHNSPTSTSPSTWNRIVTSVIFRSVPSATHNRFYTKLVELGVKTLNDKVSNKITSAVTQTVSKLNRDVWDMVRSGWETWLSTLSVISATTLCCWWLQASSLEIIMQYTSSGHIKQGVTWLQNASKTVSVDRAVMLGMGLLGGVATAVSLHANVLIDFDHTNPTDADVKQRKVVDDCSEVPTAAVPSEGKDVCESTPFANNNCTGQWMQCFEHCPQSRRVLKHVHSFIGELLLHKTYPRQEGTMSADAVPNCTDLARREKLVCICVMLVALFAHRMKCQQEKYTWLVYVYYSRLNTLLHLKR